MKEIRYYQTKVNIEIHFCLWYWVILIKVSVYSSNFDCNVSGLNANANDDGNVEANDDDNSNCNVNTDGTSNCNINTGGKK